MDQLLIIMKNTKFKSISFLLFLFIISSTSAQIISRENSKKEKSNNHQKFDVDEIRGMKSKAGYASLEQHGFTNTKTFQEDDVTYKLWYNSKKDQCIKTYSKNYYIARVENSSGCTGKVTSGNVSDKLDLKGMKSKSAYAKLEQNGFSNTKTFQEDDVTYKLWYNSKKDECIKTYSKNYYIARAEKSNSCK